MKTLITHDVGNDYVCKVVITNNKKLAVRFETSEGDYIGQLFTTYAGVFDTFNSMSSGIELTSDELNLIKTKMQVSEGNVSKLLRESYNMNEKSGILKSDISEDRLTIKKGSKVTYTYETKNRVLKVNYNDNSISLVLDDDEAVDDFIKE